MDNLLAVILITMVPWIELRGSIPVGIGMGLDPWLVLFTVLIFNILIFFPIFFGLRFIYSFLSKWKFFEKTVTRIRKKGEPYIKKYGVIGLALFIGTPLPGTGVYAGTLLAWLLGLKWQKAFLAAALGVLIASSIIFAAVMGVFSFARIFI